MSDLWSRRLRAVPWTPRARYPQLVPGDAIVLDVRRHPATLFLPALRTVLGLVVLTTGAASGLVVGLFALTVAAWARTRLRTGLRKTFVLAAVVTVALLVAAGNAALVLGLALVLWILEDVADWFTDRLVVSRKRIYRLYGVLTRHSPSMALTSVTFIEGLETPVGRFLGYGTIRLDSVAQRDEPLSRFDFLPEADFVHAKILELRTAAMPQYPLPGQAW